MFVKMSTWILLSIIFELCLGQQSIDLFEDYQVGKNAGVSIAFLALLLIFFVLVINGIRWKIIYKMPRMPVN